MFYQYVAYTEGGELVKGRLSAETEDAASELLDYSGYQIVSLKRHVPLLDLGKLSASMAPVVKPSEIVLVYRQLALLLESGTDIAAAMDLLQSQVDNRTLKKVLADVSAGIRGGNQLSAVLERHPKVFPTMYCRLLGVGEQSGDLESVLRQVADYMEKEVITNKETKSALMMPTITVVVSVLVIGVVITFVLPAFTDLYASLNVEIPAMAQILIDVGEQAKSNGMYLLLGAAAIAAGVYAYVRTPRGRFTWDGLLLRIPMVGRVRLLTERARFCRSMSLLFRSGMPLNDAMSLAIRGTGNKAVASALTNVQADMVKGEGLARPMSKNPLFLPLLVQMTKVGEETGNLDVTLGAVAQSYEAEAEDKIKSLIALIPPLMTVVLGGVVGLIAVTLMSAMTGMYGGGP